MGCHFSRIMFEQLLNLFELLLSLSYRKCSCKVRYRKGYVKKDGVLQLSPNIRTRKTTTANTDNDSGKWIRKIRNSLRLGVFSITKHSYVPIFFSFPFVYVRQTTSIYVYFLLFSIWLCPSNYFQTIWTHWLVWIAVVAADLVIEIDRAQVTVSRRVCSKMTFRIAATECAVHTQVSIFEIA